MGRGGTTPLFPHLSTLKEYHPGLQRRISNKTTVLDAGTAQRTKTGLYLNITFISMQRSPTYSVPLKFSGQNLFKELATSSTHAKIPLSFHILFGQTKNIWSTAHNLKPVIYTIRLHELVTDPDLGCRNLLVILFKPNPWTKLHINKTSYAPITA